jgi:hypothetical protein
MDGKSTCQDNKSIDIETNESRILKRKESQHDGKNYLQFKRIQLIN